MADYPSIAQLEEIGDDLPPVRWKGEAGTLRLEDGEYVGIKTPDGRYLEAAPDNLGTYDLYPVEVEAGDGWEPISAWWQKRLSAERAEYEAGVVRRARANAKAKPRLAPIDLLASTKDGTKHGHPDIEPDDETVYVAKIRGEVYIGTFGEQHYGLCFHDGFGVSGSHQFDPPGTNYSGWEGLWRLEMPEQLEVEAHTVEGITYTVTRSPEGTTVDTPCQCMGLPIRMHDNPDCPWLAQAREGRED